MRLKIKEQDTVNVILEYLLKCGIVPIHHRNTGNIVTKEGKNHFYRAKFSQPGVADILLSFHGYALAIEVKSETGKMSPDQKDWAKKWTTFPNLGLYFLVKSLDEVLDILELVKTKMRPAREKPYVPS